MRESSVRKLSLSLSRPVADRLQAFVEATGLTASAVVDHSLEVYFESQPDAAIVQNIRVLSEAVDAPPDQTWK